MPLLLIVKLKLLNTIRGTSTIPTPAMRSSITKVSKNAMALSLLSASHLKSAKIKLIASSYSLNSWMIKRKERCLLVIGHLSVFFSYARSPILNVYHCALRPVICYIFSIISTLVSYARLWYVGTETLVAHNAASRVSLVLFDFFVNLFINLLKAFIRCFVFIIYAYTKVIFYFLRFGSNNQVVFSKQPKKVTSMTLVIAFAVYSTFITASNEVFYNHAGLFLLNIDTMLLHLHASWPYVKLRILESTIIFYLFALWLLRALGVSFFAILGFISVYTLNSIASCVVKVARYLYSGLLRLLPYYSIRLQLRLDFSSLVLFTTTTFELCFALGVAWRRISLFILVMLILF